ncbi:MAG TPA: hypothetical protein ENJ16_05325, partial [Planctomycetaceae bacterium]|nr:hypothetical protein [Planctomycetaceae bacterium]
MLAGVPRRGAGAGGSGSGQRVAPASVGARWQPPGRLVDRVVGEPRMTKGEDRTSHREGRPQPVAPPLELTTVWQCASVEQAEQLLAGEVPWDVYRRDGHPGARRLTELWCRRHEARWAMATSSGMAALAALLLARLRPGDHVLLAEELYGRTQRLFQEEGSRWGITVDHVDPCTLESLEQAWRPESRLLLVETISNPRLRVVDVERLARWCHDR